LYRDLWADATFHQLLLACDGDLADLARAARCTRCGGVLHSACYPRKPRDRPCRLGPEHDQRFSFCCAVDGCRSRATPPSLRFLGRKVYLAAIVVLVAIMRHGVTTSRIDRLSQAVGVDRRTVARWRVWWQDRFTATPFWQVARAAFMPPIDREHLPGSLLELVVGMLADEVDHLAIAVGRLSAVAARLVHHSEAVPAVVHIGEADQQVACGRLGLVELGRGDELHHGIGGGVQFVPLHR